MVKRCVICGEEFKSIQPAAKYCGVVCQMDANRIRNRWNKKLVRGSMKAKKCENCGRLIITDAHYRKYCNECAELNRNKKLHKKAEVRKPTKKVIQPDGTVNCTEEILKKCQYGGKCGQTWICNYIEVEGKSRRCPAAACDKFKPIEDMDAYIAGKRKKILTKAIGL